MHAGARRQAGDNGGHCHIYKSAPPNNGVGGDSMEGVFSSVFRFFDVSCSSSVVFFLSVVSWDWEKLSLVRAGLCRAVMAIPVRSNPPESSLASWRRLDRVAME